MARGLLVLTLLGLVRPVRPGVDDQLWSYPIAPHRLLVVEPGTQTEFSLPGYDLSGNKLKTTISGLPASGTLYKLSRPYNDYGYDPKAGAQISSTPADVTGSNFRLLYKTQATDAAPFGKWDTFTYTVSSAKKTSAQGTVTIVPPSGVLVGSNFVSGSEGWTITGNRAGSAVTYDRTSRGLMNRYVYGSDDLINVGGSGGADQSLWYFRAPSAFMGNQGMAYGGTLQFTLSSFSGDFSPSALNQGAYLVYLECSSCASNAGVRLGFPLSALAAPFTGSDLAVSIPLTETAGWLQDTKNTLQAWSAPSRCTFIQVLSSLSGLSILGDFTVWYESVSLDSVALVNTRALLPMCAQGAPDAHLCTCS